MMLTRTWKTLHVLRDRHPNNGPRNSSCLVAKSGSRWHSRARRGLRRLPAGLCVFIQAHLRITGHEDLEGSSKPHDLFNTAHCMYNNNGIYSLALLSASLHLKESFRIKSQPIRVLWPQALDIEMSTFFAFLPFADIKVPKYYWWRQTLMKMLNNTATLICFLVSVSENVSVILVVPLSLFHVSLSCST